MATIDLRDHPVLAGARAENANCIENVSIHSRWKSNKRHYRDRGVTRQAIIDVLKTTDRPLSRREIAHRVEREKGGAVINVIADLVAAGLVVEREYTYRGIVPMFVYEWAGAAS